MIMHTTGAKVEVAMIVPGKTCPSCGSKMTRRPCPCPFRRKGWATCAQCVNRRCKKTVGLEKKKR